MNSNMQIITVVLNSRKCIPCLPIKNMLYFSNLLKHFTFPVFPTIDFVLSIFLCVCHISVIHLEWRLSGL
jgi:hypothetical protein